MTTPTTKIAAVVKFVMTYDRWTRAEFTLGTGLSRKAAERTIQDLHAAKAIHIDEWLSDNLGRMSIAVFATGEGRDARRRKPVSGAQRTAAYKRRQASEAIHTLSKFMLPLKEET